MQLSLLSSLFLISLGSARPVEDDEVWVTTSTSFATTITAPGIAHPTATAFDHEEQLIFSAAPYSGSGPHTYIKKFADLWTFYAS